MYQGPGRHQARQNRAYPQGEFQRNDHRRGPQLPPIDLTRVATAIRLKNFKLLLDTAGSAENLALALDAKLPRVNELARGEQFDSETAMHIEMTLELASGFLDQANPRLTAEVVNRLKSPLNFNYPEAEPEVVHSAPSAPPAHVAPVSPASTTKQPAQLNLIEPLQQQEIEMAKTAAAKTAAPSSAKPAFEMKFPAEPILDTRRLNLAVLTGKPGTKGKLGEILGLSPANVSHRLHGMKRLEDDEIVTIASKLGMDAKWFDKPRHTKDIPAEVNEMLDPGPKLPRGAKKAQREAAALAAGKPLPKPPAKRAAKGARTRVVVPADVSIPKLSAGIVESTRRTHPVPTPALAAVGAPAAAPRQATAPARAPVQRAPAPAAAPAAPATVRAAAPVATAPSTAGTPVVTADDLGTIGPIAEALIKTLAIKARTGKLDEVRAMALLTEVAQF